VAAVQFNGILSKVLRNNAEARQKAIDGGALRIKSLEFGDLMAMAPIQQGDR
jgi:hypothetical protein